MVLVGNKTDLAEQREVSEEEARAFADRWARAVALQRQQRCEARGRHIHQPANKLQLTLIMFMLLISSQHMAVG